MAQSRSEETRQRVLEATSALIIEHGIATVTLRDIQQASGVSNGSIFHHFGSKDGIVAEIFAEERRDYLGSVASAVMEWPGDDPCDAFGAGARASLQWQCDHPERFSRLIAAFTDSDWMREHGELWLKVADEVERPLIEWARPHIEAGRLPLMPSALFQCIFMGAPERLSNAWQVGRLARAPNEFADEVVFMVVAALKAMRDHQHGTA